MTRTIPNVIETEISIEPGEPNFTSAPVYMSQLKSFIDCGTYIHYVTSRNRDEQCYGQIVRTESNGADAVVNQYIDIDSYRDQYESNEAPLLKNPYVEVSELVQTLQTVVVPQDHICGLIFYFARMI